jgi:antitoxin MazE
MLKKLTKHGNSLALLIDKGVLDILNITSETPLNVSTDGQVLIITPVYEKDRPKNFDAALNKVNRKYGKVLKKLAD